MCTNFEGVGGERAEKKRDFLVEIFQKVPKNACCWPFFKSLNAAQKICSKWGLYRDLRDLRRKQFGRPKTMVDKTV